ncbi:hypothetical protein TUM20983_20690 [Mycobacterium antarcticum]|uniref:DUF2561 family protein n=1 Tax=unclassified Mycolicibacterium TaxID=2636767 RepID=UPI002388CF4C|nr:MULTISPECIES: DUF2561 family protein [unclassified Mycolicibacterium]GLP74959.1 hypothetical protein TUM20983_20690 [Mycolicibacterium sp. TUM20983]GLP80748.1 hypothetical protein TUM20984_21680 [Mycolicibacterium sp. TUM20984]
MTHDTGAVVTPDRTDRILVIVAIAFWLAALGAAVAAVVALVGLTNSETVGPSGGSSDTPWLLYTVIGVSAAVIVGAIPLLLRARQTATSDGASRPAAADAGNVAGDAPGLTQRLQPFGAPVQRRHPLPTAGGPVGFPTAAVEQIWLRCTSVVTAATGAAATGVGVATYLMATHHDSASWAVYVVAGVITVAMCAAPWYFLRQLRHVLAGSR